MYFAVSEQHALTKIRIDGRSMTPTRIGLTSGSWVLGEKEKKAARANTGEVVRGGKKLAGTYFSRQELCKKWSDQGQ